MRGSPPSRARLARFWPAMLVETESVEAVQGEGDTEGEVEGEEANMYSSWAPKRVAPPLDDRCCERSEWA